MQRREFTFYGGAREFVRYHGPEAIIHGSAETGKTISALMKIHLCAIKYKNAQLVILRKTQRSANSTVIQTWQNKVIQGIDSIQTYGGGTPQWFDYSSGARVWVMGLDNDEKLLSGEFDLVYVNQVEELTEGEWETITTRTTGRAGNMPYAQTIGDCNPAYPTHWMYSRKSLKMFYSKHEENPVLYDQEAGEITEQGKRTLAVLDSLTGVRKQRLRYGKPAQAEGAVYEEWDQSIHLVYPDAVPEIRRYVAAQDWGYTNAGVLGVWGVTGDNDMYLVAQVYQTGRTIDWWAETAKELQEEYGRFDAVACDPAEPAYIAAYRKAGLNAVEADNSVLPGINRVKKRLAEKRLFVVRDSLRSADMSLVEKHLPKSVEEEFPMYVWAGKAGKEAPVKENDHGMDQVRYAVAQVDKPRGVFFM